MPHISPQPSLTRQANDDRVMSRRRAERPWPQQRLRWRGSKVNSLCFTDKPKTQPNLLPTEEQTPDIGVARQFGSDARHGDPASGEDIADIGEFQPFPGILLDEDDRLALVLLKFLQYFKHHVDEAWLKTDRWFVNEQHCRIHNERSSDLQ
jgi:hypothetical protein